VATIYDLAKSLNLSVSTTSKALNGYQDVSDKTRQRVLAAARAMQFEPSVNARMLVTKRSYLIGILYVDFENMGLSHPHFNEILEHFKREVEAAGYQIMFLGNKVGPKKRTLLENCRYRGLDAVLVMAADYTHPQVAELLQSGVHCVLVDFAFPGRPSVLSDNLQGMEMLVDYLHSLKHTKMLHMAAPRGTPSGEERLEGFQQALARRNLPFSMDQVIFAKGFGFQDGYEAMERLISGGIYGTALLCNCDPLASGAMYCLSQHGLRVPQDISVTGFDNVNEDQMSPWRLTTIAQPRAQIGSMAADMCISLIEGVQVPPLVTRLPVSLVVRSSCASLA
jgi:LacI family transcriptional regulator